MNKSSNWDTVVLQLQEQIQWNKDHGNEELAIALEKAYYYAISVALVVKEQNK